MLEGRFMVDEEEAKVGDQAFEVVDRDPQNMMFPRMGTQEPDPEGRFRHERHTGCFGWRHAGLPSEDRSCWVL